jgi:hypothetical protein
MRSEGGCIEKLRKANGEKTNVGAGPRACPDFWATTNREIAKGEGRKANNYCIIHF